MAQKLLAIVEHQALVLVNLKITNGMLIIIQSIVVRYVLQNTMSN